MEGWTYIALTIALSSSVGAIIAVALGALRPSLHDSVLMSLIKGRQMRFVLEHCYETEQRIVSLESQVSALCNELDSKPKVST